MVFPGQRPGVNIICHIYIYIYIYINEIIDNLNSQAYLFADDIKLYKRINNDTYYNVLQSDLNKVDECTRLWLLKLNRGKCKCMTSINKKANNRKYFLNTSLDANELKEQMKKRILGSYRFFS